jgi:hypothetical protein
MADEPLDDLKSLPADARAQYAALSPEERAYYRPIYAAYAADLRANRRYRARIDRLLAAPQPDYAAIRKLLGVPPDADLDALLAEIKRPYARPSRPRRAAALFARGRRARFTGN